MTSGNQNAIFFFFCALHSAPDLNQLENDWMEMEYRNEEKRCICVTQVSSHIVIDGVDCFTIACSVS